MTGIDRYPSWYFLLTKNASCLCHSFPHSLTLWTADTACLASAISSGPDVFPAHVGNGVEPITTFPFVPMAFITLWEQERAQGCASEETPLSLFKCPEVLCYLKMLRMLNIPLPYKPTFCSQLFTKESKGAQCCRHWCVTLVSVAPTWKSLYGVRNRPQYCICTIDCLPSN